jgi:hypothetical protein
MKTITLFLTLFATLVLAGCMDAPGSNGQYATHDRGNGTIDKALRR